jgi:putative FmdB family regulatory protein
MGGEFTCGAGVIQRAPGTLGGYNTLRCMLARREVGRMALYEYKCAECDGRFDLMRAMSASDDPAECPECGSVESRRVISNFASITPGASGDVLEPDDGRPHRLGRRRGRLLRRGLRLRLGRPNQPSRKTSPTSSAGA